MPDNHELFITFEGIDGCGKTTQIARLAVALERLQINHVTTREPGGSEAGEKIRGILIESGQLHLEPRAEVYLFIANRVQNIAEIVKPAIAEGKIVITDRHRDSSVAFQGAGRQLGVEWIEQLHEEALDIWPDCTILLDVPVVTSRERAKLRDAHIGSGKENRFEREGFEFHERVHEAYQDLAKRHSKRFLIINGDQDIKDVSKELFGKLAKRYPDQLGQLSEITLS